MAGSVSKDVIAAVADVVNALDPIRLLALGAPPGEYSPEIEDLAALVMRAGSFDSAAVDAVWVHWFSEPLDSAVLRVMTERLLRIRDAREERPLP